MGDGLGNTFTKPPAPKTVKPLCSRDEIAEHTKQFVDDLPKQTREDIATLLKIDTHNEFSEDPRELIIILISDKLEQIGEVR
jgi:hypothetical protein